MKNKTIKYVAVIMAMFILFSISAYATADQSEEGYRLVAPTPTLSFVNGTAKCKVTLRASGQYIDATLELWQGGTLVDSWSDTGTGYLILSGSAPVTGGVPCTLTVSGTANGVAFTPASITRTP